MDCYLAIDIGASSGRTIVGFKDNNKKLVETYRFANNLLKKNNHLYWDVEHLIQEITFGIRKTLIDGYNIKSIGIDTFGVDYVLLDANNCLVRDIYSYRDERGEVARLEFAKKISEEEQFKKTGVISHSFNTLYQLYDDAKNGLLTKTKKIVFLPNYLAFLLGGKLCNEYTIASTSGIFNIVEKEYDETYLNILGIKKDVFGELVYPNTVIGKVTIPHLPEIKIITVSSHDTASAVYGSNIKEDEIFISSGTWSILGILSPKTIVTSLAFNYGFSNEASINGVRVLKNIMGLWMFNCLRKELDPEVDVVTLTSLIAERNYQETFDANDPSLFAPISMSQTISSLLKNPPDNKYDLYYAMFNSLAKSYKQGILEIEKISGKKFNKVVIFGGGIQNKLLNSLILKNIEKEIVFGNNEATAYGNILSQIALD